jgi:heme exporter protein CcmD
MFDYGKYTPYVLACYIAAGVILAGLIVWSVWRLANARRKLDAVEKEQQK